MRPVLALAAVAAFFVVPAQTAPQCNTRDYVLGLLSDKYTESVIALGLANNGNLVEVLATGDGATWSIIITTPQGMSCLVAAGEGWQALKADRDEPRT